MAIKIWVNTASGKSITWTIADLSSVRASDNHLEAIEQDQPQPSFLNQLEN